MAQSQNKKYAAIIAAVLVVVAIAFAISKLHAPVAKKGEPTIQEILAERAAQASKFTQSPLGKAIAGRNWPEATKLYNPDKQFIQLAEIIRALFIENQVKQFTPEDFQKLQEMVLKTFDEMNEKNYHLAGMLVNQFGRLPSPKHESDNFDLLKKWALDPKEKPLKRRLGIIKLGPNDAEPDPQVIKVFEKTLIDGDTYGMNRNEWVQMVEEVRNHEIQVKCLDLLAKNFKKMPEKDQPAALNVLAHHLEVNPEEIKKLTFQFLRSEAPGKFEASLRALTSLIQANLLKDREKAYIVSRLTNLPSPVKTPFVEMKSSELLNSLK